ncbi:hypothetical protein MARCHEWKA_01870 [Brevundimonas phage vB_BpoS-Marchewka]|uniref:Uncharacterized protein n=1 Tax=Brevundimonas phage vB_BpoS-Marchewka TaxID=2948604 RepID=A0A9E7ST47_9CAUD|nr:hypothetical protein MARCHEWKA_01870 [Brevundimonas phage vB_BpoS-Marchewka]UTC29146.1 hypothetical protein BAMBUS_00630 [Brevundimonas phage vB_BpoS-Bambus]
MLKLFRRRPKPPPAPPAFQPPPQVEIVETYDGYLIRQAGTGLYAWFANADVPHWHPRDWRNHDHPFGYAYSLYRSKDLELARTTCAQVEAYMGREAERDHRTAVEAFERAVYAERVIT